MTLGTTDETRLMLEIIEQQLIGLDREEERKHFPNPINPNKSICCLAVTNYFKTTKLCTYLHNSGDLLASIAKKHNIHDRYWLTDGLTVEESREVLKQNSLKETTRVKGYVIAVEEHAMVLNEFGETIVDTDEPDGKDNRIIEECNIII